MSKTIIGLVGKIASGKGTVAKYLEDNHNASIHRFSTMLRDVLNRLGLEINRENMQSLSTILRQQFGEDILAKVMANDVEKDERRVVVVDGIRRMADIKYLKILDGFKLAAIDATPENRYQRLIKRAENQGDQSKTYEEFLTDETKEADAEIPVVMSQAQFTLDNNYGYPEVYGQIEKLLK